jgi:uncharacterized iron-regulated membrane protein
MRTLRVIHRWIGIGLASVIVAVALSGGILVFRDPYFRWAYPVLQQPPAADQADLRAEVLSRIEHRWRDVGVQLVKFPQDGVNGYLVWLRDGRQAFVHPRTGGVIDQWRWFERPMALLFELHAHLFAERPGTIVNGIVALFVVFMSLTGVVLWWPARRGAFRLRGVVPRRTSPSELLRSHAATGALASLPIVLFAGTGAVMAFYEPTARMMTGLFDRRPPAEPEARVAPRAAAAQPWPALLRTLDATVSDGRLVYYYPGTAANARLMFRKRLPGEWHPNGRTYVLIDPYGGGVLQTIDPRTHGPGTQVMQKVYPVHAATVGGVALDAIAAFAALALAWLGAGGVWSYFARRAARGKRREDGTARAAA